MTSFLTDEQKDLANAIAAALSERGETVAVAEGTTGGLVSAALLWVAGASRYFAGGGVLYTLNSRVKLAGADASLFENYRGSTPEMMQAVAKSLQERLGSTWCISESGLAGPTTGRSGLPPGRTTVCVVGPATRLETYETGSTDREANMIEFTTLSLRLLLESIESASKG